MNPQVAELLAVAEMIGAELKIPIQVDTGWVKPKMKHYVPKMVTSSDKEIAEWNARVVANKHARKSK